MAKKAIQKIQSISKDSMAEAYSDALIPRLIIQSIPKIGGQLDTYFAWKGEQLQKERFEKFIYLLSEVLEKLDEEKMDKEFIESEEFNELFYEVSRQAIRSHQEEKLIYIRNIFINSLTPKYSKNFMKTSFLDILSMLSDAHIAILKLLQDDKLVGELTPYEDLVEITPEIVEKINIIKDTKTASLLLSDLERLKLVERVTIGKPLSDSSGIRPIASKVRSLAGGTDEPIGSIEERIIFSNFGKSFVDFALNTETPQS
jgi:hypothetical protein